MDKFVAVTPEQMKDLRASLVDGAKSFDAEQAQRAKEFNERYERAMGRKVHQREPITRAELATHQKQFLCDTSLPGRRLPQLLFGDGYATDPRYVPIDRRFTINRG